MNWGEWGIAIGVMAPVIALMVALRNRLDRAATHGPGWRPRTHALVMIVLGLLNLALAWNILNGDQGSRYGTSGAVWTLIRFFGPWPSALVFSGLGIGALVAAWRIARKR